MLVREPIVAGQFYPATRDACLKQIASLAPDQPPDDLPERPVAGIVPHAGWSFSGSTALAVLDAVRARRSPRSFILFGAVHRPIRGAAVFASGVWQTPLGPAQVDERLAGEILARAQDLLADDPHAHEHEHSIEVQLPLIQNRFPDARIVPIAVPPSSRAHDVGRAVAQVVRSLDADAFCLGSTDLTHYGAGYGFSPRGTGEKALRWVRDVNDRRMVDLMRRLDAETAVDEAGDRMNACGSGAIAATLAAARELGAESGRLVAYTTSADVMRERTGHADTDFFVGYAGLVF